MPRPTTPGTTKPYAGISVWTAAGLGATLDRTRCGGLAQAIADHATATIDAAVKAVDPRLEYTGEALLVHNERGKEPIPRDAVQGALDQATRAVETAAEAAVADHMRGSCEVCNPPMMA